MNEYEKIMDIIKKLHQYIQLQEKNKEKNEALINLYKTKVYLDYIEEKICEKKHPLLEDEKILYEVRTNDNSVEFIFYSNNGNSKTLWYELSTKKLMDILSKQKNLND